MCTVILFLIAVMVPSMTKARGQAKRTACASNQRQIGVAMHAYTNDYDGRFPIAHYEVKNKSEAVEQIIEWDTITDLRKGLPVVLPGLIWQHAEGGAVQQCPVYEGPSMTIGDPYTGYNYNTTYIGRGQDEKPYRGMGTEPADLSRVKYPGRAALIGDGGGSVATNKFMRAPLDTGVAEVMLYAGTQAFRHLGKTNVVFVDGHGEAREKPFLRPGTKREDERSMGWPRSGFLSEDDSAYAHR